MNELLKAVLEKTQKRRTVEGGSFRNHISGQGHNAERGM